jgi:hypothetical protein
MTSPREEIPHTQTSAPVEPPQTAQDVVPRREEEDGRKRAREATGPDAGSGGTMPAGADEPGAGM